MKKFDISNLMISRISDIYSYTLPEEHEAKGVCDHDVLIIKGRGESQYTVKGTKYLADINHILYMPAGTEYSLYVRDEGVCTVIEFDAQEGCSASECASFYTGGESDLTATAKNILHYWNLRGPAYHSKCLSELYSLVTLLSTAHSYTYSLAGKYGMIHRSVKFIEANYRKEDLYTPDLAAMSGMGETYYRSIFISVFGVAPAKYIQNYRIEKAKELLVNCSGSIEEIATSVGFANSSYFCKVFKSTIGLTPSEFTAKSKKLG